jgi:hypothetical protein
VTDWKRSCHCLALSLSISIGLSSSLAWGAGAQDAQAKREFVEANKAYDKRDYRGAAEGFERAYKLKQHPSFLWNAAKAWDKAGDSVRAANLLEQYLQEAPAGARDRESALADLKELNTRLARIEVRGVDVQNLTVDDIPIKGGAIVYVTPGEHAAVGQVGPDFVRKTVKVDAGQLLSVTLEPPPPILVAPPPPPKPKGLSPIVAIAAGGVTLVSAGLTTWSGLDTVSRKDAFLAERTSQPKLGDAFAAQTRTNIFVGITIGLAVITGVVVVLTNWKALRTERAAAPGTIAW